MIDGHWTVVYKLFCTDIHTKYLIKKNKLVLIESVIRIYRINNKE